MCRGSQLVSDRLHDGVHVHDTAIQWPPRKAVSGRNRKIWLVVTNSRQGIVILKPCVVRIVVRQVVVLKYEGEASG